MGDTAARATVGVGGRPVPRVLPGSLTLAEAAAPSASLVTEVVVVVGVIVGTVVPSFLLLCQLFQPGALAVGETTERLLGQLVEKELGPRS